MEKMKKSDVKCCNCLYYDDIMLMEACYNCSLRRSKPNESIKFKEKTKNNENN